MEDAAPDANPATDLRSDIRSIVSMQGQIQAQVHPTFDRERLVLYWTAGLLLISVWVAYFFGYVMPAESYGKAIVNAYKGNPTLSAGCYLHFLEHSNMLQTSTSVRFLAMIVGTVVTFIGSMFTIKGLEASYALDLASTEKRASLRSSSPGLVLCTLGLGLCFAALFHTASFTLQTSEQCLIH